MRETGDLVLAAEAAGADVVELGIPFSDPLADGPIIQQAAVRALRGGTTARKVLTTVASLRRFTSIPLVILSYINPILRYGPQAFVADAAQAGVDGIIVPDLPLEEAGRMVSLAREKRLAMVPLVAPTSTPDRLRRAAAAGRGFVYCVTVTGVTGKREHVSSLLEELAARVRPLTDLPLAAGFGISGPAQAQAAARFCDAVIVGSALVERVAREDTPEGRWRAAGHFIAELRSALDREHPEGVSSVPS